MRKTIYFFFFILQLYGIENSVPSREAIFQDFMKDLFQTTTAGYAILGHKPLELGGFNSLRSHLPSSNLHRSSVLGLLCLECLRDVQTKEAWIFTIHQPTHPDSYEVLVGNRPTLIAAINEHPELFQLRFGFNINPNELLAQLDQLGFCALFKGEEALQGIILGYGYENAISYERFVRRKYIKTNEFNDMTCYTPVSSSDLTKIPFSYHSNLPNNQVLIRRYQQDQKTVESFLQKPDWSKRIFSTCFKKAKKFSPKINKTFSIPQAITWSIQESCSIYLSPQFIQGMQAAEAGKLIAEPKEFLYFNYFYRDDFSTANGRANRIFSDQFFRTDPIPKTMLIPGLLAIQVLQKGADATQTIVHPQEGLFLYTIKTFEGKPFGGSFSFQDPIPIPEKDLFPGLAYGVIGMHPGEEREIFVHPDLFYGTSYGDGKPVIVRVHCDRVLEPNPNSLPLSLVPISMRNSPLSITTLEEFSSIQSKIQEWAGWQSWMHYKGSACLNEIIDLMKFEHFPLTSTEMLDLLFFEWRLYKQEELRAQQLRLRKQVDEFLPKSAARQNHTEEMSVISLAQK
jgi:hypothetical protein